MRKLFALALLFAVLCVPAAAQTDLQLCGIMHTDKDGNLICDDGPTNGIMHTDSPDGGECALTAAVLAEADVLLSMAGF